MNLRFFCHLRDALLIVYNVFSIFIYEDFTSYMLLQIEIYTTTYINLPSLFVELFLPIKMLIFVDSKR